MYDGVSAICMTICMTMYKTICVNCLYVPTTHLWTAPAEGTTPTRCSSANSRSFSRRCMGVGTQVKGHSPRPRFSLISRGTSGHAGKEDASVNGYTGTLCTMSDQSG